MLPAPAKTGPKRVAIPRPPRSAAAILYRERAFGFGHRGWSHGYRGFAVSGTDAGGQWPNRSHEQALPRACLAVFV